MSILFYGVPFVPLSTTAGRPLVAFYFFVTANLRLFLSLMKLINLKYNVIRFKEVMFEALVQRSQTLFVLALYSLLDS